jgi:hypothetical protein
MARLPLTCTSPLRFPAHPLVDSWHPQLPQPGRRFQRSLASRRLQPWFRRASATSMSRQANKATRTRPDPPRRNPGLKDQLGAAPTSSMSRQANRATRTADDCQGAAASGPLPSMGLDESALQDSPPRRPAWRVLPAAGVDSKSSTYRSVICQIANAAARLSSMPRQANKATRTRADQPRRNPGLKDQLGAAPTSSLDDRPADAGWSHPC